MTMHELTASVAAALALCLAPGCSKDDAGKTAPGSRAAAPAPAAQPAPAAAGHTAPAQAAAAAAPHAAPAQAAADTQTDVKLLALKFHHDD
ncbi:MAG: hypothetical protein D6689_09470 [Deltaproteobacteria bacterium]|nr:MAG: hypothetical protein D6689_09470 [Deltaproteobacteria bacterium]